MKSEIKLLKTIKIKDSASNLGIYGGFILGIIALVFYLITNQPMFIFPIVLCLMFIGIGFMKKKWDAIKLCEDHMELKLAPLAPLSLINYSHINKIEEKNAKSVKIHHLNKGKEIQTTVILSEFEEKDQVEFVQFLMHKMEAKSIQ
jgi:hypothetical protein